MRSVNAPQQQLWMDSYQSVSSDRNVSVWRLDEMSSWFMAQPFILEQFLLHHSRSFKYKECTTPDHFSGLLSYLFNKRWEQPVILSSSSEQKGKAFWETALTRLSSSLHSPPSVLHQKAAEQKPDDSPRGRSTWGGTVTGWHHLVTRLEREVKNRGSGPVRTERCDWLMRLQGRGGVRVWKRWLNWQLWGFTEKQHVWTETEPKTSPNALKLVLISLEEINGSDISMSVISVTRYLCQVSGECAAGFSKQHK